MVMLTHPEPRNVIPLDLSRSKLLAAFDAYEAGDVLKAACLTREAIGEHVRCLASYWQCEPKKPKRPRPKDFIRALRREDRLSEAGAEWLSDSLDACNKIAHLQKVKPSLVRCSIELTLCIVGDAPYAAADWRGGAS